MFRINGVPPPASPKFPKAEFGGDKAGFSPPFSLFENGGETEGVKTSAKTIHFRISGYISIFWNRTCLFMAH